MILVTGAGGMLGSWICAKYPGDTIGLTHSECDITRADHITGALADHLPDAVINCAGVTRGDPDRMWEVNAEAPHLLASICSEYGIRLVQVSTDCVFDGKAGWHRDDDKPDATDAYGRSKARGEIFHPDHVTVRTSFVGWPDPGGRGLLYWLHQQNGRVLGYDNWVWNGLAVPVVAECLVALAYSRRTNVVHLSGQINRKYNVLALASEVLGWDKEIIRVNHMRTVNRVLLRSGDIGFPVPGDLRHGLEQMRREGEQVCQWIKSRL